MYLIHDFSKKFHTVKPSVEVSFKSLKRRNKTVTINDVILNSGQSL